VSTMPVGNQHGPSIYEIRVRGHLESRWSEWFDGLLLTCHSDGTTVLRGQLPDQAALHGALQKLRDLGVPLISVTDLGRTTQPLRDTAPTDD